MILFYSGCLGEPVPNMLPSVLPPGSSYVMPPSATQASADHMRSTLTPLTRKALKTAQWSFIDAYIQLDQMGPFIAGREPQPRTRLEPVPAKPTADPTPVPHQSEIEEVGTAWTFFTQVVKKHSRGADRVDQHFAGMADGTFWAVIGGIDGKTKAYGFKVGAPLASFPVEGQVFACAANAQGLVVFSRIDGSDSLRQYDLSGHLIWSHGFPLEPRSADNLLFLTSLPEGDVYACVSEQYLDEKRIIWFHSQWFTVNSSGEQRTLKLVEPKNTIQWLGNDGKAVFVVANKQFYRVQGGTETPLRPFDRIGGSNCEWIAIGDDGAFYSQAYDAGSRPVSRFPARGPATWTYGKTNLNGFHAGADGTLYALSGGGLERFRPSPEPGAAIIPFSKSMPEAGRLQSLAKGLFVIDSIVEPGRFTFVKLK